MFDTNENIVLFTVDGSGHISLTNGGTPYLATTGVVGLPYTGQFKSAKLAFAAEAGTALVQKKKLGMLGVILLNAHIKALKYGADFDHLYDLPRTYKGQTLTKDHVFSSFDDGSFSFPGNWDTDSRLCLQLNAPLNATVAAAIVDLGVNERV